MKMSFNGKQPKIGDNCLIFENSTLIGDVNIGSNVSIWPYVTIRGDVSSITIGDYSNVQESSVIHGNFDLPVEIGKYVTIGHNAIVHGAKIGNYCLIGMGAIILDGAVIEDGAVVAAGCVVAPGKVVPKNHLVVGNPMKLIRELDDDSRKPFVDNTMYYVELTKKYLEEEK